MNGEPAPGADQATVSPLTRAAQTLYGVASASCHSAFAGLRLVIGAVGSSRDVGRQLVIGHSRVAVRLHCRQLRTGLWFQSTSAMQQLIVVMPAVRPFTRSPAHLDVSAVIS